MVEFVLARITEDEAVANDAIDRHPIGYDWAVRDPADADYVARWNPWRILKVCNVRRRLVAAHRAMETPTGEPECAACDFRRGQAGWPCDTIRLLVLDWVEHPDFRDEWLHRPSRIARARMLDATAPASGRLAG